MLRQKRADVFGQMVEGVFRLLINYSILPLFTTFAAVAFAANGGTTDCPGEWHSFNGSCLKYFGRNATVMLARQYCWELGGGADLASIHSAEENAFVQNLVKGANATGGWGFIIGLLFDSSHNAFWSDDSPVDFGSPDAQPAGTYPWYLNRTGIDWPSQPDNVFGIEFCAILTPIDYAWGDWNCFAYQPGFICRKSPATDASGVVPRFQLKTDVADLWPHPAFSFLSILIQFYLIWLIIMRSPKEMRSYRHFLCASTASDIAVTFIIGILIVPDNWMPREIGATVQGLGKLFGQHGGQITLSMAIYSVACQIGFQLISLIYRFSCIMDREWPKFSSKMSKPLAHKIMFLWVFSNSAMLAYLTKDVSFSPEETAGIQPAQWSSLKMISDLLLAKAPFILLNGAVLINVFGKMVFTLMLVQGICIFLTGCIIRYLRANAKHFTAHTYKLQLQLMVSLLVQLVLPCLFVGVPMLLLLFLSILFINFEEKDHTLLPSKSATSFGIFFIEFYALLNPLTVIFFVTSYRRHFAKITGISRLRRMLANAVHGQSSANHVSPAGGHISINQMHIQTTRVEEIIANKVPRPL